VLKVAIRPGKPLTVGRIGQALFVGLPGNPYAAAITFAQIARPALRKAAGITEILDLWLPAVAAFSTPMSGILFLTRSGSAKTVQALMIVNALRWQNPAHRSLVIAPDNLMSLWQEECWIRGHVMPALAGPIAGSDDDTAPVTLSRSRDLMIRPGQGMRTITADPLVVPAPWRFRQKTPNSRCHSTELATAALTRIRPDSAPLEY